MGPLVASSLFNDVPALRIPELCAPGTQIPNRLVDVLLQKPQGCAPQSFQKCVAALPPACRELLLMLPHALVDLRPTL